MAKNDEVAHSFQSLMGAHGGQVADPVIEAFLFVSYYTGFSDTWFQRAFMYISAQYPMKALYRQWLTDMYSALLSYCQGKPCFPVSH